MATLCTHCGTALKDGARYCNNCGTLVPSHPLSPQSLSSTSPSGKQYDNSKGREQIAPHPSPRPIRFSVPTEPPSWMSQLADETRTQNNESSDQLEIDRHEKSPAVTQVDQVEKPSEKAGVEQARQLHEKVKGNRVTEAPTVSWSVAPQLDFPVPEPIHRSSSPARELHIKVWEQREPAAPDPPEPEKQLLVGVGNKEEEDGVEDLPTRPLVASFPEMTISRNLLPSAATNVQDVHIDEVERINTISLATPPRVEPVSQPVKEPDQQWGEPPQPQLSSFDRPTHQNAPLYPAHTRLTIQPVQSGQGYSGVSSLSPIKDLKQKPPPQAFVSPPQPRKSRKSLLIALISLLLLLVVGGVGAWIVLFQPFSVPGITQPQQSFSNTQLGFSLLYPNGWEVQVDHGKMTAHFYDSSHTAQINIVVGPPDRGNLGQYLQQQASQLGMTGQKIAGSLSFAGASWQHLQGSIFLRGASYTETLLVTAHNSHLFTIMLLAPQTTYAQEEQLVFSVMRSSFQFIS